MNRMMTHDGGRYTRDTLRDDRGFGLVELLISMMLLTVGFLGIVGAIGSSGSSGVAAAPSRSLATVTRGYYVSAAANLAQQRLEELKQLRYQIGPPAVDQFGPDPTPAGFADEATGTITGYPNFSRQVRVQTGVPAANLKTITVTVNFLLPTQNGSNQEGLSLGTLVAATP